MKKSSIHLILIAFMLLMTPAVSVADYVDYTGYSGATISYAYGTKTGGIAAEIYIKWNSVPTWSYCIDLDNFVGDAQTIAYLGGVGAPIAALDFKEAAWIIEKNWAPGLSTTERAALQAAIWTVRYNGAFVVGSNGTAFDNYFAAYMASLSDSGFGNFIPSNYAYLDLGQVPGQIDSVQDLITRVPEPGTLILMGLGLLGLAGLRRKE